MPWSRRPERDTPRMEQRRFRDERGRLWTGSVSSGTVRGGESHAEVIFVCEDHPGQLKRVARLDMAPAEADDAWQSMDDDDVRRTFDRAEPA